MLARRVGAAPTEDTTADESKNSADRTEEKHTRHCSLNGAVVHVGRKRRDQKIAGEGGNNKGDHRKKKSET